jgi:hypothetical protein
MAQLLEQVGDVGEARVITTLQPDDLPMPPPLYSHRTRVVASLAESLTHSAWLALVGGPGEGKTQLALATASSLYAVALRWISFRNVEPVATEPHLREQLALWIAELETASERLPLYLPMGAAQLAKRVTAVAPGRVVLVVDNLPDPLGAPALFEAITALAAIFAHNGLALLTTGHWAPPPAVVTTKTVGFSSASRGAIRP